MCYNFFVMNENIYTTLGASNHSESLRAKDDFYTTPLIAVEKLLKELNKLNITLPKLIIEPSVGTGSIAIPLKEQGHEIIAYDIVDRGYPNTIVSDWLTVKERKDENLAIIANFPYKDIQKHTEHALELLKNGEYLISLAKIQFLESKKRRELFKKNPPKYVFVFSERIKCLSNGKESAGSSAIAFCWYVFEKGYSGLPQVDWI